MINITPFWSADRRKIAFARHNNVTGRERGIYVINADGSGETRLTNSDGQGYDYGPVFSPDGSKIVYYSDNNSIEQIIIMNSDGSNPNPRDRRPCKTNLLRSLWFDTANDLHP